MARRANVVLVLADDLGYSDIGCYGGEIPTPNLDRLAAGGTRMTQFYNTARCMPSRASLLTGLHPHQAGVGVIPPYSTDLNDRCATIAEVLQNHGYATYLSGKWHLTTSHHEPSDTWPTRRGFEHFYGTVQGAGSYFDPATLTRGEVSVQHEVLEPDFYYTDAISAAAAGFVEEHARQRPQDPFFLYLAYTAPHWPLHAPEEGVAAFRGRYDAGWDALREQRLRRLRELDILDGSWPLSDRDPNVPAWADTPHQEWEASRMEVYAAQVERLDRGIGRVVAALEAAGALDDTLIVFLSDNGGCAETQPVGWADELPTVPRFVRTHTRDGRRVFRGNTPEVAPGPEDTYASYGRGWANLSNTPFREYKRWVHEGGIATPLIAHWPAGLPEAGAVRHLPHQLPDVMATVLEATGADYPDSRPGRELLPLEGMSMLPALRGEAASEQTLYWEHEGNAAVRRGRWKLVCKYPGEWELHDLATDRTELHDLAPANPDVVAELAVAYLRWADRCGVVPWEAVVEGPARRAP